MMKYINKDFKEEFVISKNTFIKGKHPDICPDCKEEPNMQDVNASFVNDELWIVKCKCSQPHIKTVCGDSISEAVLNWDEMIKRCKEKNR